MEADRSRVLYEPRSPISPTAVYQEILGAVFECSYAWEGALRRTRGSKIIAARPPIATFSASGKRLDHPTSRPPLPVPNPSLRAYPDSFREEMTRG